MRRLADCGNCPLYPEHRNPCFGSGPGDAQLVVIGTAPERNEVEQGTPFIGQTGWLLDATLKEAGHSREHTYVTRSEEHTSELQSRENLVCRPLLEKKKPYL